MTKRHTIALSSDDYAKISKMALQDKRSIASMLSVLISEGRHPGTSSAAHTAHPDPSAGKPKSKDQGQDTWYPKTSWRTGKPISGFSKEYGVITPWGVEFADMTPEQRNPNRIKPYEEWVEIAQQWPQSEEVVFTPDGTQWRMTQGDIVKPTRCNEDGVAYLSDWYMELPCMTCAEIREAHRNGTLELDQMGYFHYRLDEFRQGFYDAEVGYFSVSDGT
jgi:hypothetical protein